MTETQTPYIIDGHMKTENRTLETAADIRGIRLCADTETGEVFSFRAMRGDRELGQVLFGAEDARRLGEYLLSWSALSQEGGEG